MWRGGVKNSCDTCSTNSIVFHVEVFPTKGFWVRRHLLTIWRRSNPLRHMQMKKGTLDISEMPTTLTRVLTQFFFFYCKAWLTPWTSSLWHQPCSLSLWLSWATLSFTVSLLISAPLSWFLVLLPRDMKHLWTLRHILKHTSCLLALCLKIVPSLFLLYLPLCEFMNFCPAIPNHHSTSTGLICQNDAMSRCC